jgi:hypothetical protein
MKSARRSLLLSFVATTMLGSAALHGEPQWIWSQTKAYDYEKETFRKTFTVSGNVKTAVLKLTCDNGATAMLNGKKVLENPDWNQPVHADVAKELHKGQNELVIEGRNVHGAAALLASLTIEAPNGEKQLVETGPDWETAKPGTTDFHSVVVIAKYGAKPWGPVFDHAATLAGSAVVADPATLTVPMGFKAELLYTVPKENEGSWVSLTVDAKGRLIASDQYGGLYRITVPAPGSKAETKVEALPVQIGGAHGLLYANDSLYVMVNEKAVPYPREQGLWRLKYRASDDSFEEPALLRKIPSGGEHGPHSIVLGPDGKTIYFCCGNHSKLPDHLELSRAAQAWDEDQLVPRLWDPNGHARGVLAPGGYIDHTDPEGKTVEMYTAGFRNPFDFAIDGNGEIFTYDADMEWDIGLPWYRPTRICHAISGGDFGWRSGNGKWPVYYPDSLPPVQDIGPGSPTGMIFGTGAKFPAKYQRAMFALDWTYGTLYAIHFIPDGGSFRAEKEEFVAGKPLPLTDAVIDPKDGALYFAVGGRKTQSALFRVTYTGSESTAPVAALPPTPEAKLRRELEKLHDAGTGPEAIDKAWPHLANKDRFVRFAARVAIERQPVEKWTERALADGPQRQGDRDLTRGSAQAFGSFFWAGPPDIAGRRGFAKARAGRTGSSRFPPTGTRSTTGLAPRIRPLLYPLRQAGGGRLCAGRGEIRPALSACGSLYQSRARHVAHLPRFEIDRREDCAAPRHHARRRRRHRHGVAARAEYRLRRCRKQHDEQPAQPAGHRLRLCPAQCARRLDTGTAQDLLRLVPTHPCLARWQ